MSLSAESVGVAVAPQPSADRRASLFRETPFETAERWALGTAWAFKDGRAADLPGLARLWLGDLARRQAGLPDPDATVTAAGHCGIVRDLSVPTLMQAYRRGLFTFAHFGPLKWMSLPERCVLFFDELHIGKKLRRQMRQGRYRVTFDRDFEAVIKACAGRRDGKWHCTWITPQIMRAYAALYDAGHAHSFEVWNEAGALVGGGYGVAVGRTFFTESQFSLEPNTSKLGFTVLNKHLADWGFVFNDGKWPTPTITDMGFRSIPRAEFQRLLGQGVALAYDGPWQVTSDLAAVAAWQPAGDASRPAEPRGA